MNKKKTILLANPNIEFNKTIPFALLDIERALRQYDIEIVIIDEQITDNFESAVIEYKDQVMFCFVSVEIQNIRPSLHNQMRIAKIIKKTCKCPIALVGFSKIGWNAYIRAEDIIKEDLIDFVIAGQSELPAQKLVEHFLEYENHIYNSNISSIPNLIYQKDSEIFHNTELKPYNTNHLEPINLSLIDLKQYVRNNTIEYVASYGCGFNCSFCCQSLYWRGLFFHKDVEVVLKDISYIVNEVKDINHLCFIDDNMFYNKDFILDLAKGFIKNGFTFKWNGITDIYSFINNFTQNDIELLIKSGLVSLFAGAESGSEKTLHLYRKKHSVDDNISFTKLLVKNKLITELSFIVIHPENIKESFYSTIKHIMHLKLIQHKLHYILFTYFPYDQKDTAESIILEQINQFGYEYMPKTEIPSIYKNIGEKVIMSYLKKMRYYGDYYFRFIDPNHYKKFNKTNKWQKLTLMIINKSWYPIIYLRFKLKIVNFPIDALVLSSIIDKLTKRKSKLDSKNYIKFRYTNL